MYEVIVKENKKHRFTRLIETDAEPEVGGIVTFEDGVVAEVHKIKGNRVVAKLFKPHKENIVKQYMEL